MLEMGPEKHTCELATGWGEEMRAIEDSFCTVSLNWGMAPFAKMGKAYGGGMGLVREMESWL